MSIAGPLRDVARGGLRLSADVPRNCPKKSPNAAQLFTQARNTSSRLKVDHTCAAWLAARIAADKRCDISL
ncbi:MAG: hypothetical protein IV110_00625 [Aquabacterium sp.]|nr:hypothetical protein [Aquabacterium sp.]